MSHHILNMFAAKKVKLHGMTAAKWTTKDKITQYKGLISLYTRDRKIIELDATVNKRKTLRELKDIAKKVYIDRRTLDNAIRGDKQQLRNTLSENKELQLAYQNSQPKIVIDEIDQLNFNKRKVLDRIQYEKKIKSQKLIDLKLEQALLEDRLKYDFLREIKQEKEAQIVTGKVQDATLRKEAAWSILNIYREILDIMKKDALYFDAIIETVRNDGYLQSKCFLGATKLGQLATEYLDDRKQDFYTLEKIILKDMATRKTDIRVLTENVESAAAGIRQLLRKDSDITTCIVNVTDSGSLQQLTKDLKSAERSLNLLQNMTRVPSYEAIFPCLQEQQKQRKRLKHLAKKCEKDRDYVLNKLNHAQLMDSVLKTSMEDDISEYKEKKREFQRTMNELTEERQHIEKVIGDKRKIAAEIRLALRQLLQISYDVKIPESYKKKASQIANYPFPVHEKKTKKEIPEEDEIDGTKVMSILLQKFSILMSTYFARQTEPNLKEAFIDFQYMMQQRINLKKHEREMSSTSLLQGLYTDTSHELSREDIKKQSNEIVTANTKQDDMIAVVVAPSKSKKKKKN